MQVPVRIEPCSEKDDSMSVRLSTASTASVALHDGCNLASLLHKLHDPVSFSYDDDDEDEDAELSCLAATLIYDSHWSALAAAPAAPDIIDKYKVAAHVAAVPPFNLVWDILHDLDDMLAEMSLKVAVRFPELPWQHMHVAKNNPETICLDELVPGPYFHRDEAKRPSKSPSEIGEAKVSTSEEFERQPAFACSVISHKSESCFCEPDLNRLRKMFEFAFNEFAGDIYDELEIGFDPSSSLGFIHSCFAFNSTCSRNSAPSQNQCVLNILKCMVNSILKVGHPLDYVSHSPFFLACCFGISPIMSFIVLAALSVVSGFLVTLLLVFLFVFGLPARLYVYSLRSHAPSYPAFDWEVFLFLCTFCIVCMLMLMLGDVHATSSSTFALTCSANLT